MPIVVFLVLLMGCASTRPVVIPVPAPPAGELGTSVEAMEALGDVQPIAVGITNNRDHALRLDVTQVYAYGADGARVAPLPPGEAARCAGGRSLPGVVESSAKGAARGGITGALGSAINGLILGAVAGGVGIGAAAGAAVGAIGGAITGAAGTTPDVAGFEERALKSTTLASSFSTTGFVYYPAGTYTTVEILLTRTDDVVVPVRVDVPVAPD